jgi:hypothetical protein
MRTKTRYREIKSENIPIEKELPVEAVIAAPEGPTVAMAVDPQPQAEQPKPQAADEPALALSKQLAALKQSEELQRQQAAQVALQQPMTREQRLALWRQHGLSDAEAHFLQQHPEMIDHPQIANAAAAEAMQAGHERDGEDYWKATEMNFNNHLTRLRTQANPGEQATPAFFSTTDATGTADADKYLFSPGDSFCTWHKSRARS